MLAQACARGLVPRLLFSFSLRLQWVSYEEEQEEQENYVVLSFGFGFRHDVELKTKPALLRPAPVLCRSAEWLKLQLDLWTNEVIMQLSTQSAELFRLNMFALSC